MCQDDSLERWMDRAVAYELLSMMFLLPTGELAEALVAGEFAAACGEAFAALGCDGEERAGAVRMLAGYEGDDPEALFRALRGEHTRLLIGRRATSATPYVGVWAASRRGRKGRLFVGEETVAIERFMRRRGVAKNLAAGQANDPVDHVGTVCEFLKFLCLVNARAVQAPPNAEVSAGDFEAFVSGHFAEYAEWLSGRLLELTREPFFRAAAVLLKTLVALPAPAAASAA